jgi:hypothetical protein
LQDKAFQSFFMIGIMPEPTYNQNTGGGGKLGGPGGAELTGAAPGGGLCRQIQAYQGQEHEFSHKDPL